MPVNNANKALFVDEVEIIAIAGSGGNGCIAFRREKYIPKGGPYGGDGGDGGSVYLLADPQFNTLQHLAGHHHWRAQRGGHGEGKNCHGKNGEDITIPVPPGTIVRDADHKFVLKDLAQPGDRICVAQGGKGGKGNSRFKTSINQAPRIAEPGTPGEERNLSLELKLIADVGLVGMPNAGKSTLLSRTTQARPKIADYPFTTLTPHLGIVELPGFRRFVMADIPGLIEGAHDGAGLGDAFLKHIERTRLLVHLVDLMPMEGDPAEHYRAIRKELEQYSTILASKPEILVANKTDLTGSQEKLQEFRERLGADIIGISAVTGEGLGPLSEKIWKVLQEQTAAEASNG